MKKWRIAAMCATLLCSAAHAEVSEVKITKQFGVGFLPLMVMEDQKLVEKQSKAAGLPEVKGVFMTLSNPAAMNDGLLSGQIDFGTNGPPARDTCPRDAELLSPVSVSALGDALVRARACFERQLSAGRPWREVR